MKGKHIKTGPALYNGIANGNAAAKNRTTTDSTPRTERLPLPLQEHTILPVRVWKGDSRALPAGMSQLQRTTEKAQKSSGDREDAGRKATRRPENNKTHTEIREATSRLDIEQGKKNG